MKSLLFLDVYPRCGAVPAMLPWALALCWGKASSEGNMLR